MKSIIFTFALIVVLCGLCHGQKKKVYVPSDSEIEELLNDPKKVREVVDCVIRFTPGKCDPKLKDAYDLAPEYFATGGSCRSCSDDILRKVRRFLQRLQKKYRKEYQRLINNVT